MSKKRQILIVCIFLTVATFIAFWQVSHCDFINYDDDSYVTGNSQIQNGITIAGIRWAFTSIHEANWHPITWISHMMDVQLFGLKPGWHHLTNLLFHIVNTLLLFLVFHRMTKALWQSAFVAALFALHPLHVESVAWVAERKDVLSTFFLMLTMAAYIYYVERPELRRYLPVLLFFVLGLMAKPMLVTLPFVLLLLDHWPLQRFEQKKSVQETRIEVNKPVSGNKRKGKSKKKHTVKEETKAEKPADHKYQYQWTLIRPLLWEKIPLFALTALSSIATYIAQQKEGAMGSIEAFPFSVRIANAFVSYIIYIGKTIWPSNLAVFYPHPKLWPLWQVLGAVLFVIAVTLMVIWMAKRFPYLAMGWLWYIGTLVPVIGIVQVGSQARADRYTYVPLIGLFIMVVWGITELLKKWRHRKEALFVLSALTLSCLFVVTWLQVGYWQNSIMLFGHALKVTDHNSLAFCNRGVAYASLDNYRQAIGDYDKAIELDPKFAKAYDNRGAAYGSLGNYRKAIEDCSKAIELDPEFAKAYDNRGVAYASLGNNRQAIGDYDKAIELDPKFAKAFYSRGVAYYDLGNYKQAIGDYDKAIELDPKFAKAYDNRAAAYGSLGNYRKAIEDWSKAIELDPKSAMVYYNLGVAYWSLGNYRQANENLKIAARSGSKLAQNILRSQGINW
ncbi:MAG: tetratricopeptide repeat protein [Syntrophales bacterium]|jgi:tetratricopeptide (TPR) repeat protein